MDYYGKRLVTCSSDKSIRIFDTTLTDINSSSKPIQVLKGHDGPVWQAIFAHPKFGSLLASCSYDGKVLIWKENSGTGTGFIMIKEHKIHSASVNSIDWCPHEFGLSLACASSDGSLSILTCLEDGNWHHEVIPNAHSLGANAVSWAPATLPGSLISVNGGNEGNLIKRLVSGGCDNLVKIWIHDKTSNSWKLEFTLEKHSDWVRDVAWAPNIGLPTNMIATCSQDKTVIIWTWDNNSKNWKEKLLKSEPFTDVIWRVSWSASGNILAVSGGDNKVTLWKENLEGNWNLVGDVTE